jgi:hypothetical protein
MDKITILCPVPHPAWGLTVRRGVRRWYNERQVARAAVAAPEPEKDDEIEALLDNLEAALVLG